jgi:ribonuclease HI
LLTATLFKQDGIVLQQQNNGAELLACVLALKIALKTPDDWDLVVTDSKLIHEYWSRNKCNALNAMDPVKQKLVALLIESAAQWRSLKGESAFQLISGNINSADLGFHK